MRLDEALRQSRHVEMAALQPGLRIWRGGITKGVVEGVSKGFAEGFAEGFAKGLAKGFVNGNPIFGNPLANIYVYIYIYT